MALRDCSTAFAIENEIELDVLIVDWALVIADARFQHESAARMKELREKSTTILLVTHIMTTVRGGNAPSSSKCGGDVLAGNVARSRGCALRRSG